MPVTPPQQFNSYPQASLSPEVLYLGDGRTGSRKTKSELQQQIDAAYAAGDQETLTGLVQQWNLMVEQKNVNFHDGRTKKKSVLQQQIDAAYAAGDQEKLTELMQQWNEMMEQKDVAFAAAAAQSKKKSVLQQQIDAAYAAGDQETLTGLVQQWNLMVEQKNVAFREEEAAHAAQNKKKKKKKGSIAKINRLDDPRGFEEWRDSLPSPPLSPEEVNSVPRPGAPVKASPAASASPMMDAAAQARMRLWMLPQKDRDAIKEKKRKAEAAAEAAKLAAAEAEAEARRLRQEELDLRAKTYNTFLDIKNYPLEGTQHYDEWVQRLRKAMLEQRDIAMNATNASLEELKKLRNDAKKAAKKVKNAHEGAIGKRWFINKQTGEEKTFNIGKRKVPGAFKGTLRTIQNPITDEEMVLSRGAGAYHKNPLSILNVKNGTLLAAEAVRELRRGADPGVAGSAPQGLEVGRARWLMTRPATRSVEWNRRAAAADDTGSTPPRSAYFYGGRKTRRRRHKRKSTRKAKRHRKSKRGRKGKKTKSKRRTRRH